MGCRVALDNPLSACARLLVAVVLLSECMAVVERQLNAPLLFRCSAGILVRLPLYSIRRNSQPWYSKYIVLKQLSMLFNEIS